MQNQNVSYFIKPKDGSYRRVLEYLKKRLETVGPRIRLSGRRAAPLVWPVSPLIAGHMLEDAEKDTRRMISVICKHGSRYRRLRPVPFVGSRIDMEALIRRYNRRKRPHVVHSMKFAI